MKRTFVLLACTAVLASATGADGSTSIVNVGVDGHVTNPVWYHDSTAVPVGSHVYFAWTTNHASVSVKDWNAASNVWASKPLRLSVATLDCQCVDSTGTNPNRHDVPALFADPAGRVYAMYGGGTASKLTRPSTGPYFRAASATGSIRAWGPEQLLPVPGAAYDLEAVRDNLGVNHLIGQQGDNADGAGSLVYFRFLAGTSTAPGSFAEPYRILVKGGDDPAACAWQPTSGCDIFVIGRIAVGAADPANPAAPAPLFVTWGWSEKNLSGTCGDPAGFCNRGLYLAVSHDQGLTWTNVDGTASTDLATGSIAYDDARYQVLDPSVNVGLFKAIAAVGSTSPAPWIVFQRNADVNGGAIGVARYVGGSWALSTIDASRPWNNHLVMRAASSGRVYLWSDVAQTGTHSASVYVWSTTSGSTWTRSSLSVGANWYLTGRSLTKSGELLVWRAPSSTTSATDVEFTIAPVS